VIDRARRAVEAALAAGATDAEGYLSQDRGREVRVHGGQVESLSAATKRGLGMRAWIGSRVGYAYDTDLSEAGIGALAARAVEMARVADEDEFAGPPLPVRLMDPAGAKSAPELSDSSVATWSSADVAELALAIERAARVADGRVAVEHRSQGRQSEGQPRGDSPRNDCVATRPAWTSPDQFA